MYATYHNHTTFSDGKADIDAMVASAQSLGAAEIGLSDHLTMLESGDTPSWSMSPDRLGEYIQLLNNQRRSASIPVRIGLEVDYLRGREAVIADTLDALPLDYVLGSVHFVALPGQAAREIDGSPQWWASLNESQRNNVHRAYWQLMKELADSRLFDIAAHLDLPKKFGYPATCDLTTEIDSALDAIARTDMAIEINTAGWHKPVNDAYPTSDILSRARARDIPALISADAHRPDHLLRDFDRAAARLRQAGYEHIVRYDNRERRPVALPD